MLTVLRVAGLIQYLHLCLCQRLYQLNTTTLNSFYKIIKFPED